MSLESKCSFMVRLFFGFFLCIWLDLDLSMSWTLAGFWICEHQAVFNLYYICFWYFFSWRKIFFLVWNEWERGREREFGKKGAGTPEKVAIGGNAVSCFPLMVHFVEKKPNQNITSLWWHVWNGPIRFWCRMSHTW